MTKYSASVSFSNPSIYPAKSYTVSAATKEQAKAKVRAAAEKVGPVFQVNVRAI